MVKHFIHHLSPNGVAGSYSPMVRYLQVFRNEGAIRKAIVEADLIDCIIALPDKFFYSTGIPACLWFLSHNKKNSKYGDNRNEVLFIDARNMGNMIDRVHRELTKRYIEFLRHITLGESKYNKKIIKIFQDLQICFFIRD